jgi:hypothetical protein
VRPPLSACAALFVALAAAGGSRTERELAVDGTVDGDVLRAGESG